MPHLEPEESMVAWAMGSFSAAILVLGFVLIAFLSDSLTSSSSSSSTASGVLIYLVLWLPSCYCSFRAVQTIRLQQARAPMFRLLRTGPYWGGWTGVIVACISYVGAVALVGSSQGLVYLPIAAVYFLMPAFLGMVVGFVIGWLVGLIFTLLTALFWYYARMVVPRTSAEVVAAA